MVSGEMAQWLSEPCLGLQQDMHILLELRNRKVEPHKMRYRFRSQVQKIVARIRKKPASQGRRREGRTGRGSVSKCRR